MGGELIKTPKTISEWLAVSSKFETRWNFPNGLFAIDGKRVLLQQPPNNGSHYYDYKGHNSILAMVAVGPEYEILCTNVGMNGRMSDGGNWIRNKFRGLLEDKNNPLNLPPPRPLPVRSRAMPYVAVGDDAFPLSSYMLKPYPSSSLTTEERIFNYRLSRMRRISENVLRIMANKFRVLRNAILLTPEKAASIVLAIMVLHNFLRSDKCYINAATLDENAGPGSAGQPCPSWIDLPCLKHGQNYSNDAKQIRDEFQNYFNFQGAVSWQWLAARIDG